MCWVVFTSADGDINVRRALGYSKFQKNREQGGKYDGILLSLHQITEIVLQIRKRMHSLIKFNNRTYNIDSFLFEQFDFLGRKRNICI
jgi:hypothetical protein